MVEFLKIEPLYKREEVKVVKKPRALSCPAPLKRWTLKEITETPLNNKFIEIMKKLEYKAIPSENKIMLTRDVPIPEGKIIDELVLSKKDSTYKLSDRRLSVRETPVTIGITKRRAIEISPHITESQINNVNIGICKMKDGEWKRTLRCCDLSKTYKP